MRTTRLGEQGLEVSEIGLGCMAMTNIYGPRDDAEAIATIRHALDRGVTFLDTSDMYGEGRNEELIGAALGGRRRQATVATKFGNLRLADGRTGVNGRPDYVPVACEGSLRRLKTDVIDLYYLHRVDPDVPIEDTVGAMARLVEAGKVRCVGLSEAGARTVRRAHAAHPITALQTEYSLWSRDVETEILPACRELGIGFVAYAPLGRGFLSGLIVEEEALAAGDRRRQMPRFAGENLKRNAALLVTLGVIAAERNATAAQIALAWLMAQGGDIVPIPGTKRRKWLDENIGAAGIALTDEDIGRLDQAFPPGAAKGARYPEAQLSRLGI